MHNVLLKYYKTIILFCLIPFTAFSHFPEQWNKSELFNEKEKGELIINNIKFYYRAGSRYSGYSHYEFSVLVQWRESGDSSLTSLPGTSKIKTPAKNNKWKKQNLNGALSDSPNCKILTRDNLLILKTEVEDEFKATTIYYCWKLNAKTSLFDFQGSCKLK